MPTYAYHCQACGLRREVSHGMFEEPPVRCTCGRAMDKDIAASFPHVSLQWHLDQGIGDRLVIPAARRQQAARGRDGDPGNPAGPGR